MEDTLSVTSLMYNKNIKGPSTVPRRTPDSTDIGLEDAPSATTDRVRSVRNVESTSIQDYLYCNNEANQKTPMRHCIESFAEI